MLLLTILKSTNKKDIKATSYLYTFYTNAAYISYQTPNPLLT